MTKISRRDFTKAGLAASAVLGALPTFLSAQEPARYMKVGTACVEITPEFFPVLVNGGFTPRYVEKVHDPLLVRVLVVDDGTTTLVFATADVCTIPDTIVQAVKARVAEKTPLKPHQIAISSTHCHSAPSLMRLLGVPADERYVPFFEAKVVEAILAAYANRQDARIGWGSDFDANNVFCRRFLMRPGAAWTQNRDFTGSTGDYAQMNPGNKIGEAICRTGVPNPAVYLLAFQTPEGKPLACLANYSTHYAGAPDLSADYFGVFCREMETRLGNGQPFFAMMTNGTSGDTNCIDFYNPTRKFDMFTVGKSVAEAALRAYSKITFADWVPLHVEYCEPELGIRKGTPEQVAAAKTHLAKLENPEKPVTIEDVYAFQTVYLESWPNTRKVPLQVFRLGEVGITLLPTETYSATGHAIRRNSPATMTFTISMANGYLGYLPTEADFALGGYTTWRASSSCLEVTAEEKIQKTLLEMLKKVFSQSISQ
ncbi:MAG: hypothetical protein Q4D62_08950 [Planctomycetia bacterium]|nr:hypothetical protein [Planctomycetia bacterium]